MSHDFLLGEVVFSPIVAACLLAFVLTALTSWMLIRLDLYRWLWRRPFRRGRPVLRLARTDLHLLSPTRNPLS